jgi:hypothetical protein
MCPFCVLNWFDRKLEIVAVSFRTFAKRTETRLHLSETLRFHGGECVDGSLWHVAPCGVVEVD